MFHTVLLPLSTGACFQNDIIPDCASSTRLNKPNNERTVWVTARPWHDMIVCQFFFHQHKLDSTEIQPHKSELQYGTICVHSYTESENPHLTKCQVESLVTPLTFLDTLCPHLASCCMLILIPGDHTDKMIVNRAFLLKREEGTCAYELINFSFKHCPFVFLCIIYRQWRVCLYFFLAVISCCVH